MSHQRLEHSYFQNYIGNYFCSDCLNRSGLAGLSTDWQLLDFYASSFAHQKTLHLIYDQDILCKFYHQSYKNWSMHFSYFSHQYSNHSIQKRQIVLPSRYLLLQIQLLSLLICQYIRSVPG